MTIRDLHAEQAAIPEPPLPEGAKVIEPIEVEVGNWRAMYVDAELEFGGITWLRAQGGFGEGQEQHWHPREDWIGDLPEVSLHVGRYWNKPDEWKHDREVTMEEAMREAIERGLTFARWERHKTRSKLRGLDKAIETLERTT